MANTKAGTTGTRKRAASTTRTPKAGAGRNMAKGTTRKPAATRSRSARST